VANDGVKGGTDCALEAKAENGVDNKLVLAQNTLIHLLNKRNLEIQVLLGQILRGKEGKEREERGGEWSTSVVEKQQMGGKHVRRGETASSSWDRRWLGRIQSA